MGVRVKLLHWGRGGGVMNKVGDARHYGRRGIGRRVGHNDGWA